MAGVTQQQLDGLGARFDKGLDEIKSLIRSFEERVRAVEQKEAGCYPLLDARIQAIEKEVLEHKNQIDTLQKLIQEQILTASTLSETVKSIVGWGKWAARIATALIITGLTFFIGRMIYLSVAGV